MSRLTIKSISVRVGRTLRGMALNLDCRSGTEWADTHALRALLAHGHDVVGNLLLGDIARDRFLAAPVPDLILEARKGEEYARLAREAARGEITGSAAGASSRSSRPLP